MYGKSTCDYSVKIKKSDVFFLCIAGYFFADVCDMLLYERTRKSYELLLHHAVVSRGK